MFIPVLGSVRHGILYAGESEEAWWLPSLDEQDVLLKFTSRFIFIFA